MKPRHVCLATLVAAIWAFSFTVIRGALMDVPPMFLCAVRFLLTSLPLVFIVKRPAIPTRQLVLYGLFMFAFQLGFVVWGMQLGTSAGVSAVVMQLHVFVTVGLAFGLLKERPSIWQMSGGSVALLGIGVIASNVGGEVTASGLGVTALGAISWGIANVIAKKLGGVSMVALIAWGSLVAWPPLLAGSLIFEGSGQLAQSVRVIDWTAVGAILYLAYPGTLIAFALWSRLLSLYPAASVAPFSLFVPVFAMLTAAWILGEQMQWWKMVATGLVIGGLCVSTFGQRSLLAIRVTLLSKMASSID